MRNRRGFSVRVLVSTAIACSTLMVAPAIGAQSAWAATSKNLIKNPSAEAAPGGSGAVVAVPSWTMTTGATFTAVKYGVGGGFPDATSPGAHNRGLNFFAGGPSDASSTIVAVQTIPLKKYATAIAGGGVTFALSAYLGGFASQNDQASIEVDFRDKHALTIDSATIGPVTAADRASVTGLLQRLANGSVPVGSKTIFVQMILVRTEGSYNDAYADNLSLTLSGV